MKKILDNKIFLFLVPNLLIFYYFLSYYNSNFCRNNGEILFYEVIIISLITFVFNTIIYFILRKIFNDEYYKIFICGILFDFIYFWPNVFSIIFVLMTIILFKYYVKISLKYFISFISFFVIFLFGYSFIVSCYYLMYNNLNSLSYDNDKDIVVDNELDTPNIYWVHSDAMFGIEVMKKYFKYDNDKLINYFDSNGYVYNKEAILVSGHSTKKALPALFNPSYYDKYYKDYLYDLENVFLEKKSLPDKMFNYYELRDKRLSNELFMALKKKNYVTYGIGSFDQHTSLYTDYYYNYSNLGYYDHNLSGKLKKMDYSSNKDKYPAYIKLTHFDTILAHSYLDKFIKIDDYNFLNDKELNYKDVDLDGYEYIKNSSYAPVLAIMKSLDDIMNNDDKRFVFVDYYLNHFPINYDSLGNRLYGKSQYDISYYVGNYKYSVNLLIDMLRYIHDNDKDAVIILQADHGINMGNDDFLMNCLDISNDEVQILRNSVMNAFYIPDNYKRDDDYVMKNPLNISRYLVNHFVGYNYEYIG